MKPDRQTLLQHTNSPQPKSSFVPYLMDCLTHNGVDIKSQEIAKYWKPGEWIWDGKIPRSHFHFDFMYSIMGEIDQYFLGEKWKRDISDYPEENWDDPTKQDYFMENFLKFVWLLNEYTTQGGFKNPLFCHYNPRIDKIVIHPGGVRALVEGLFGGEYVDASFFNTDNYFQEFMHDMEPWDLEEKFTLGGYDCIGVPDHGSIIPHAGIDMHIIPGHKKDWYWRIYNRISDGKLNIKLKFTDTNKNIDKFRSWVGQWITDTASQDVTHVTFTNAPTKIDIIRAVYAVFAEIEYQDDKLSVSK